MGRHYGVLWRLGLLLLLAACTESPHPLDVARDTVRAKLPIGMPIEEAVALVDEAWHHAECPYSEYGESAYHLFFFGSRDFGGAEVVIVEAKGPHDDQVVAWIGTVDDSRRGMIYDCIEPDRS